MQFQVPQFIEVEDKIFGPFTFRQFIYLIGGAGLAFIAWRTLPIYFSLPIIATALGAGAGLAFIKYNSRPLILALEHGFLYLIRNKLYLWDAMRKQKTEKREKNRAKTAEKDQIKVPKLADSKLHELAWSLDIKERIEGNVRDIPQNAEDKVAAVKTARDAQV